MRATPAIVAALLIPFLASTVSAQSGQRFKPTAVMDPTGFERPIPAAHILIPPHWVHRGGVVWEPNATCNADVAKFAWVAGDPNGHVAVEIIPGTGWQSTTLPAYYGNVGGCTNAALRTAQEYLQALVQIQRPGAAVLDYRDRPDLVAETGLGAVQQHGPNRRTWVEAGEILIGYHYQSQNVREVISAVVIFNHAQMPGPDGMDQFFIGTSLPAFAMRAPDGQLDFQLAETIRRSVKPDPEWQRRRRQGQMAIADINARGARDRARMSAETSNIIARNSREVGDIIHQGWKDRQAMIDKGQDNWSLMTREQEVYRDPMATGGQVELPNTYGHVWRLQDGTYMMTDNPNLDPNVDMGVNAEQLERMR